MAVYHYLEDHDDNTSLWYHVGSTNAANEESTGGLNQDITCQKTRGYYFMYCLSKTCSFNVSVTIAGAISVNPTGSEVWKSVQTHKRNCRMDK